MNKAARPGPQITNMNRRDFLASAAAVTAGVILGRPAWAGDDGFIDAHSHIWTRDVEHFPLAKGATVDDLDPPSFTAEELLQTCRPEGVKRVVLIQHHTYYGFDNRYLIHAAKKYPGVFKVVGMVDDQKPHPDVTMRRLLEQNVTGFRITSWIRRERWLDGPGMAAMWRCGAETHQAMCCLIDPPDLAGVDHMCGRYAETPVVIDHFARIGVDGEIRDSDVKALCDLARHPQVHVKISAFYALGKKKAPYLDLVPMIRRLYDAYGPQRLMWASDSPYQVVSGHRYGDSIALVRDRLDFLSAADREWMLRKTAENVYFTPGSEG
jgi:predicted TIM-barrel fold metal-dependent hydrolase